MSRNKKEFWISPAIVKSILTNRIFISIEGNFGIEQNQKTKFADGNWVVVDPKEFDLENPKSVLYLLSIESEDAWIEEIALENLEGNPNEKEIKEVLGIEYLYFEPTFD